MLKIQKVVIIFVSFFFFSFWLNIRLVYNIWIGYRYREIIKKHANIDFNSLFMLFFLFFLWIIDLGLSKFAKLARSVTRSRQLAQHIPALKDPAKQSNLAQVSFNQLSKQNCWEKVKIQQFKLVKLLSI